MKIAIIGAGNVGSALANLLIAKKMCKKVTLIDINKNLALGKAIDLAQSACILGVDMQVVGGDNYELIRDFDIVVITAGLPRKQGQSRDDLALTNAKIVSECAQNTAKFAPNSIIIVVTNPLDLMTFVAYKASKFEAKRVIGMAGELDLARLKYEICTKFNTKFSNIDAKCIGLHAQTMIFPISNLKFKNKSLKNKVMTDFSTLENNAKFGGSKIVELMNMSAFYAPAAGVVKIIQAINGSINDILSCCVVQNDVCIGTLVNIDKNGVKKLIKLKLNKSEKDKFKQNLAEIKAKISKLNLN